MKKGDVLELDITSYAFEGKGIAKINADGEDGKNFVIFVEGAYPGDRVEARIVKVKKSYAEAKTLGVITPSAERITARCTYFGTCGGCKQQDLDYSSQLNYKHGQVKDIFERIGGFKSFEFNSIVPSEKIYFYRNKMEYSFSDRRWLTADEIASGTEFDRSFSLGLHIPGMFDKVLDIHECFLQSELSNSVLNFTREFFVNQGIDIYSTKTHTGYLRNLVIKTAHHTDDFMVNLVTSTDDEQLMSAYTTALIAAMPAVTTVVNNVNTKKAQIATGEYEKVYYGPGYIYDSIGSYRFRISANSFFQTNTLQAEKLYQTAMNFGAFQKDEVIYDLYSGAGTISIFASGHVREVYAFETVEAAVADAEENKILNGIDNVHFITADLNKSFLDKIKLNSIPSPDAVILDPPRSGMNPVTVADVVKLEPEKIVYISCNPATQARDIKLFNAEGYSLMKVKPVDMFPHTYHIENVALLVKD